MDEKGGDLVVTQMKEKCIPGVTQPSHEAMQKALLFLLDTSVPRLAAKRAQAMKETK